MGDAQVYRIEEPDSAEQLDIGIFRYQASAPVNRRPYQCHTSRDDPRGSDARVRRATQCLAMGGSDPRRGVVPYVEPAERRKASTSSATIGYG